MPTLTGSSGSIPDGSAKFQQYKKCAPSLERQLGRKERVSRLSGFGLRTHHSPIHLKYKEPWQSGNAAAWKAVVNPTKVARVQISPVPPNFNQTMESWQNPVMRLIRNQRPTLQRLREFKSRRLRHDQNENEIVLLMLLWGHS
jgi:hypothetical protein